MNPQIKLEHSAGYCISTYLYFFSYLFVIPSAILLCFPIFQGINGLWLFFIGSTVLMLILRSVSKHLGKQHDLLKQSIENDLFVYGEIIELITFEALELTDCHPIQLKVLCQNAQGEPHILESKFIPKRVPRPVVGQYVRVYYVDDRFENRYIYLNEYYNESQIHASINKQTAPPRKHQQLRPYRDISYPNELTH